MQKIFIKSFFLIFGIVYLLHSEEFIKYEMHLKDGRIIQIKYFEMEKDGKILFLDRNDLERIIETDQISVISGMYESANEIDCILLKDGRKLCGRIIEYKPGKHILFNQINSDNVQFKVKDISHILSMTISAKTYNNSYFEIGGNLGFPAAVNAYIGFWYGLFGIHASGMHIYLADGLQANIALNLYDQTNIRHSLSLAGGFSNIRKDKRGSEGILKNFHWEYIGSTYNIFYKGFWTEIGLSFGEGNYTNPQLLFQLGYVYRFTD
jgi:hypothetical protein